MGRKNWFDFGAESAAGIEDEVLSDRCRRQTRPAGRSGGKQCRASARCSTPRIALADRKITALIALEHLQRQGCEAAVLADIKSEPFLDELRKELEMPIVSLLAKLDDKVKSGTIQTMACLGTAVPQEFFAEHFGPAVKWVSPDEGDEGRICQDPKSVRGIAPQWFDAGI